MVWRTHLPISSIRVVIINATWPVLMVKTLLVIRLILRTTLWITVIILASLTTITRKRMAMVCPLGRCFLERRHRLVKEVSYSRIILHFSKLKTSISVWIKFYLKTHQMQLKLRLSKIFSTCQQMYRICSRIRQRHRTRQRGCFRHRKVQAWVTRHKPLQHSIAQASRTGVTCARLPSLHRKDLRISIILYS